MPLKCTLSNLTLYSIITPFDTFEISYIWKYYGKWSIFLWTNATFSINFQKYSKLFLMFLEFTSMGPFRGNWLAACIAGLTPDLKKGAPGDQVWDLLCVQLASYLVRAQLMWMMPLHLHVNQKSLYDDYDEFFQCCLKKKMMSWSKNSLWSKGLKVVYTNFSLLIWMHHAIKIMKW